MQQDTEVTDGGCHLYPDRVFTGTLQDHFVPSQGNTVIASCDPPSEDKISLSRRTPDKKTIF